MDSNQSEIVAGLRDYGCSVQHLHMIGRGCPDLLVGYEGLNYLFEIKNGNSPLTPDEEDWFEAWEGDVVIIRSLEDAIAELMG